MEYAHIGKQAAPLDYSKLTGNLIDTLKTVQSERQAERVSLDKAHMDADKEIQETEKFSNQTLGELALDGADMLRDKMYEWNKELKAGRLSPKEYRAKINNTQAGWSMFANTAKTFDETMKNGLERQQEGDDGKIPGSRYEQYLYGMFAENANLGNTKLGLGKNGKIFLSKFDNKGNVTRTVDVSRMGNPGNMIDNRFNLRDSVKPDVATWGKWKIGTPIGRGQVQTIENIRDNLEYNNMVDKKVQSILSNNRSTASVLADNGVGEYDYYQSSEELDAAVLKHLEDSKRVAEASGLELSEEQIRTLAQEKKDRMIIVMEDPTGVMQPIPTEVQQQAARKRVEAEIEMQLGYTKTTTAGFAPKAAGGKGGAGDGAVRGFATYTAFRDAWRSGDKADAEAAMNALNPKYKFTRSEDGKTWDIYQTKVTYDEKRKKEIIIDTPVVLGVTNPRDMSTFLYKTGTKKGDTAHERYDREQERFFEAHPEERTGGRGVKEKKDTYDTDKGLSTSEWNKKWNSLPSGASMMGQNGEIYTKD